MTNVQLIFQSINPTKHTSNDSATKFVKHQKICFPGHPCILRTTKTTKTSTSILITTETTWYDVAARKMKKKIVQEMF